MHGLNIIDEEAVNGCHLQDLNSADVQNIKAFRKMGDFEDG